MASNMQTTRSFLTLVPRLNTYRLAQQAWEFGEQTTPRRSCTRALAVSAMVLVLNGLSYASGEMASIQATNPTSISVSAVANSNNCEHVGRFVDELHLSVLQVHAQFQQVPQPSPLGASGKFHLAVRNFLDPLGIAGTAIDSGISTATSSETSDFGTGWPGFGRRFGMAIADTGVSEFFSTFLVSTLAHQDPHYHRKPDASVGKRIVYALSRVAIARSDSGHPMFNYSEFVGTTAASLVETTFHYEREESPSAVSSRIFISIGYDAAWNLMSEFLPDIAKHVNPRFIFLRRLAERAASQH